MNSNVWTAFNPYHKQQCILCILTDDVIVNFSFLTEISLIYLAIVYGKVTNVVTLVTFALYPLN